MAIKYKVGDKLFFKLDEDAIMIYIVSEIRGNILNKKTKHYYVLNSIGTIKNVYNNQTLALYEPYADWVDKAITVRYATNTELTLYGK